MLRFAQKKRPINDRPHDQISIQNKLQRFCVSTENEDNLPYIINLSRQID